MMIVLLGLQIPNISAGGPSNLSTYKLVWLYTNTKISIIQQLAIRKMYITYIVSLHIKGTVHSNGAIKALPHLPHAGKPREYTKIASPGVGALFY